LSGCNAHLPKADQSPANVRVAATSPPSPEPTELHAARLFRISQNTKIGYIDRTGNIVIQPQFDAGRDFSEGLAAIGKIAERTVGGVRTPELRWGFINERGQIVISAKFT